MKEFLLTLKEVFPKILTKENITFLIAVISFCLSVFSLIKSAIQNRESYEIKLIDYATRKKDIVQFMVVILNYSANPLSIVSFSAGETTCELVSKAIRGYPENWNFRSTPNFPVCIPAHGCQYAYLEFVGYQGIPLAPGTKLTFEIRSTHQRRSKTVLLGDTSHYLHTRE